MCRIPIIETAFRDASNRNDRTIGRTGGRLRIILERGTRTIVKAIAYIQSFLTIVLTVRKYVLQDEAFTFFVVESQAVAR